MPPFSPLEDQIRECFGRVVYTHKTHEKMAEGCAKTLQNYKLAQIAVSALTALSALASNGVFTKRFQSIVVARPHLNPISRYAAKG